MEIVAGNDAPQCMGAWMLWRAWGLERFGREIDSGAWLRQWQDKRANGGFVQVVAWEGPVPVAMAEVHMHYEVFLSETHGWGEKGYCLPAYRGAKLWSRMVQAAEDIALGLGAKMLIVPTATDETGEHLGEMYLRRGYSLAGKQYHKEVRNVVL